MASKKGLRDSIGGIFADLLEDDINVSSAQADSKTESQGVLSARSSLDEDENYFGKLGKNLSRTINAMDDESGTAEPGQATAGGILKSRSSRTDQLEMEAKAVKDTNLSLASIRHPRKISFDDEDVLGPLGLEDKKENELEQPARKSGREYWDYPDSPNRNTSPKSPAPAVPHDWLGRKPSMLERSTSDFEVEEKVPAFGSYRPSFSSSAARCQPPPLSRQSSMLSNGVNIAGYSQLRPDNWDTKKPDQKVSTSRVTNEKRSGEKQQPSISLQNDQNAGQTRCTAPAQSGMKTGAIKERITSTPHKCKNALQLVESTVSSLAVDHSSDKELHATRDVEIKLHQLEVENVQLKAFLEAQQKRHEQELVSLEDMYKWRNKLQSESMDLREARLQAEMNELTAMLKTVRNESEAERTRLMEASAQRLADADRERNRDFERLRELQRKAVSEMQKDYEEQMQRLRRLKDQEVDAVTSATAQTRSLSTVIEHMEAFSQRLGELASQLDGYRKNSRQDADFEMRQREQQIKALQNSLESQRKDLQQERSELHKVISRLEARLQEQTRLLEEERHRLLAERSKTEALQGSMAENMRAMLEQRDLEREELQKAKMKLLLEREEWERNCLDVPKGLGREHSELGQQRKQFASRCEHKVTDVAAKGGFYVGLAQQREAKEQVTRDLAQLEQQRNAIRVEAAHLSAHKKKLARQAEEVRIANKVIANHLFASLIFLQLASQKYAEGEQALQEVRHVLAVDRGRVGRTKLQTWGVYEQEKGLVQNSLGNLVKRKLTSTKVSGALSDRLEPSLSALTTDDSQTHLAFFKHMASQDHDFIKREDLFLMNLRKHQLHGQFTTA
uniref:fas-binding factor 1 isoform X9 n=1 Tax=Myxine glutinosa TaxID=7769 RepID=UPI00358FBC6A